MVTQRRTSEDSHEKLLAGATEKNGNHQIIDAQVSSFWLFMLMSFVTILEGDDWGICVVAKQSVFLCGVFQDTDQKGIQEQILIRDLMLLWCICVWWFPRENGGVQGHHGMREHILSSDRSLTSSYCS